MIRHCCGVLDDQHTFAWECMDCMIYVPLDSYIEILLRIVLSLFPNLPFSYLFKPATSESKPADINKKEKSGGPKGAGEVCY